MLIIEKIKEDQIQARKKQDHFSLGLLSTLFAEVEKVGKDKKNSVTTDLEAISVVKKFIANNHDFIKVCQSIDKKEALRKENVILNNYLPKQLDESEMKSIIQKNSLVGISSVMAYFKTHYNGQYDGKILSQIAKGSG